MINFVKNGTVKRLVFALLILAVIIPTFFVTYYGHTPGRAIGLSVFALIGMIGMYEVLETIGFSKYVSALSTLIVPAFFFLTWGDFNAIINNEKSWTGLADMMHMSIGHWQGWLLIFGASFVPLIADQWRRKNVKIAVQQLTATTMFIIVPVFAKVIWTINIFDITYLFFFLPIPIISDTMAYFGGMFFGKKMFKGAKFAPKTSPKKTWAGFVIGTACAVTFAIIAGYFMGVWKDFNTFNGEEIMISVLFGLFLSIISPYGDLLFSWFKRKADKKDYSNLLPGHGGIFDRVDAMAVVIVFAGVLLLFAEIH